MELGSAALTLWRILKTFKDLDDFEWELLQDLPRALELRVAVLSGRRMLDTFPPTSAAPAPQALIDPLSGTSVRLEMLVQGIPVADGSGFLWAEAGQTSLVTAWHNVTGKDPETGQPLLGGAARPDAVRAYFSTRQMGKRLVREIPLYANDNSARFRTHLSFGRAVDVVAIDIEDIPSSPGVLCTSVNDLPEAPIAARIGASVFVVGFPRGLSPFGTPIWKRGTIATEPCLVDAQSGKESYLLDTATREGMSGAPTFCSPTAALKMSAAISNSAEEGRQNSSAFIRGASQARTNWTPNLASCGQLG